MLVMVCAALPLRGQEGVWTGKLEVSGTELALVFNLSDEGATLDVPDQGAKGIAVEVSRDAVGGIELNIPMISASFKGIYLGKTIVGPFPYTTEEVSFSNGDAVLKGTLTMPADCDRKTPVLVMVTGQRSPEQGRGIVWSQAVRSHRGCFREGGDRHAAVR